MYRCYYYSLPTYELKKFSEKHCHAEVLAGTSSCARRALRYAEKNINMLYASRYLPKLDISLDRVIKETVGLRPYRTLRPRIEKEPLGEYKTLVHNYGHGGSGWSLSWGSASLVTDLVASTQEKQIAVIGCGVIGLTTALTLQYHGYDGNHLYERNGSGYHPSDLEER